MAEGVSYTIHGTKLIFPCKAYPTQLCMMDKIMKGLDRRQHCLLESPTGSGKSLALLCSCLAWQTAEYEKAKAQEEEESCKTSPSAGSCCDSKTASPALKPVENAQVIDLTSSESPVRNENSTPSADSKISTTEIKPHGDDEEDDFKCENKRFRTPGNIKSFRADFEDNRSYNEDCNNVANNDPPEVKAEPTNKESPCSSNETKTSGESDCKKDKNAEKIRVPKIYFGTRTHKQVAQITRELGKTAYKHARMCILSSREHSCIHPKVSTGRNKNEECRKLLDTSIKGETCFYYSKSSVLGSHANLKRLGLASAWDIEDFTRVGKKMRACPYYAARELMKEADIIFCPYNYLIDPKIRMQMEIDLKDQILVLDEAHNVEDSARESASLSITSIELQETLDDIDKMISWRIMPGNYQSLHLMCANLMRWMTKNSDGRMQDRGFEQAVRVMSGADILEGLREAGITPGAYTIYQNLFNEIMAADRDPDMNYEKTAPSSQSVMILEGLFLVLGYVFGHDGKFLSDYRLTIMKTAVVVRGEQLPGGWKRAGFGTKKEWTYSLNFWCFNPAVVFSYIGSQARSIILTSGTLSPMSSFASELGVPFSIKLEANHVIANSQVWVGTLSVGPSRSPINASYRYSETFSFQDDIGNLLLEVCEKVPHGVLCFFPSYNMLEKVSRRWQSTGLWSKLLQKKLVLSEPRSGGKTDFDDVMHEFYQAIRRSEGEEDEGVDSDDEEYCVSTGGALFLAVCRGKVSEGLDFADNNARAVITVGIPFPSTKDLKVDLKRKYNDEHASKRGLLNGNEWYEIQAFRALNQALGRCIRHKQDWGAILLVDERFTKTPRYSNSISKWVRQRIQHYTDFNQAIGSLKEFADARQLIPCPATQTPKSATRTSLSSTADGSFLSDTSPNRDEPATPCASTPIAPKMDLSSQLSNNACQQNISSLDTQLVSTPISNSKHAEQTNPMNQNNPQATVQLSTSVLASGHQNVSENSKQIMSTPISNSKHLNQTNPMNQNNPQATVQLSASVIDSRPQNVSENSKQMMSTPISNSKHVEQTIPRTSGSNATNQPIVNVNPTGINASVNQILVNSQQTSQGIPQHGIQVLHNVNPQVPQRFIFIPNNNLGTSGNTVRPLIINSGSPTAPRGATPMGGNTVRPLILNSGSPTVPRGATPMGGNTVRPLILNSGSPTVPRGATPMGGNTVRPVIINSGSSTAPRGATPMGSNTVRPVIINSGSSTAPRGATPMGSNTVRPLILNSGSPTVPRGATPMGGNTVRPVIINSGSSTAPRGATPLGGNRVQQVLFLTPVQMNNQHIRGQTPRFVYTTPKTIVFTPNGNSPQPATAQNLPAVAPQAQESLAQGSLVTRPSNSVSQRTTTIVNQSGQDVLSKEKFVTLSEPCKGEIKNAVVDQTDATNASCGPSVPSEHFKDENSDELVDRNKSTQEEEMKEECPKKHSQETSAEFSESKQLQSNNETQENILYKKDMSVGVAKESKNEFEMRELEFPESPDMFSTPSPETETDFPSKSNTDNEDKGHGLKAVTADTKTDRNTSDRQSDKDLSRDTLLSNPQENTSGYSTQVDAFEKVPLGVSRDHSVKEVEKLKAEVGEDNIDLEKENSKACKKMRLDSNPTYVKTRTTRRNPVINEQENEKTDKTDENLEETKPLRRNLRRAAQRQGLRTMKPVENKRDVQNNASEDSSSCSTMSLCCKRCNSQVFKGLATKQTIHNQNLTNIYNKFVTLNSKTRLNKKRKRGSTLDRMVWMVDHKDVGGSVGLMVEPDKGSSQQGNLLNALYVPTENHVYIPLQCTGCRTTGTPCFVIGVKVMSLSSTHSTGPVSASTQVYLFNEAVGDAVKDKK